MSLFTDRLHADAEDVERALEAWLPMPEDDAAGNLHESMRYSALGGGKRLRGHLVLTFCTLFGGEREAALPYAAAIEMMHAFSLIHDDLPAMDNDDMRRGRPSNHKVYGEATALLAGDALALRALETAASNPYCDAKQNAEAARLLASAAGAAGMCGGQQIDLQSEQQTIPMELLTDLVLRKTGALFAVSCELGLIAASAFDEEAHASARTFARHIGLAFQITDDLLDLRSTPEVLGKTTGKDEKSGKATFPALLGVKEAEALAKSHCEQAVSLLDKLPAGDERSSLRGLCEFILTRTM
ncbi:MAG: polyprenyl synthetase family protein [Oscillospiraceae bacterium]|nr:polyprenyl synthetase family protein [Oscillospiraceae bacterium]